MSSCLFFCATDNESLVSTVLSPKIVADKRLRVDIAFLRDLICHNPSIRFFWVPTKEQLADCMTKSTAPAIETLNKTLFATSLWRFSLLAKQLENRYARRPKLCGSKPWKPKFVTHNYNLFISYCLSVKALFISYC